MPFSVPALRSLLRPTKSNTSFASDHDETVYLQRTRRLHWARIGVAITLLIFALVGLGCEGNALSYYFATNKYADVYLHLWPKKLDIGPSVAAIVTDSLVIATAVGYLVVALLPSPRSRTTILNILSITFGFLCVVICAISAAMFIIYSHPHEESGTYHGQTLHSWTCTWSYSPVHEYTDRDAAPEKIDGVKDFARLCAQTKVSIAATSVLIAGSMVFAMLGSRAFQMQRFMKMKRDAAARARAWYGSLETLDGNGKPASVNTSSTAV